MHRERASIEVGQWAHVMNRGVARRPIFETERDLRSFEALLRREVREARIEVHAFAFLLNHYHLLVRSPTGQISRALQNVQGTYSRWFNRTRDRDGPLVRRRFLSRTIEGHEHFSTVVRYIDANPVAAGIVRSPAEFPHCSAHWYARPCGPDWLERSFVESVVTTACDLRRYEPARYFDVFPALVDESVSWWVDRQLSARPAAPLNLMDSAPSRVRRRLLENIQNSDGRWRSRPLVAPRPLLRRVEAERGAERQSAWLPLKVGLLQSACGLSGTEVAETLDISAATVSRAGRRHRRRVLEEDDYLSLAERLVTEAERAMFDEREE